VGHPPLLPALVVVLRLRELDEVADGPRDHVVVGLEMGLGLLEGARQRGREITTDGGLLGDDEDLGHEEDTLAKGANGDTAPRDGASLAALPRARRRQLVAGQAPLPAARDRARARATRGRLRARGE